MSDEYQLRKDIDRLIRDVYDLSSGALRLTTTDEFDKLVDRLDSDNSLDVLETNLISFKGNLDDFNTSLISFESDLEEYGGELGTFSGQLSGFTTAINNLKNWMYGYNPLDPTITYENPSSDSIKGMINTLDNLLHEIEAGDGIVLENLGRLKDHLKAFSGNLAEFKQYLTSKGVNVSTLDDSVISLILEINNNISTIENHQTLIEKAEETIGEPATATSEATGFYKKFDDGDAIMEDLDGRAEDIELTLNGDEDNKGLIEKTDDMIDTIYDEDEGLLVQTNDIIDTIGEPAQGQQSATGMHLLIDNAQSTANAVDGVVELVKGKIGYNSIGDTNLQQQITNQGGTISSQGSRLTSAEGTISSQGSRITSAESTISSQGSRITSAEGTISSQGSRLTSAEGTISAHGGRLTTVEGQISTLDGQYSSVSSAVSDITDTELPRLDGALDTLGEFATALAYSLSQILKPTSDYTEIYYCSGVPDTQDLLIWEADYGYDTSNIMYAINQTGTEYVRNGSNWATGTIPSSITKRIGVIGYFDERPQEGFNPSFDYIYSVSTTEYFKLTSQ